MIWYLIKYRCHWQRCAKQLTYIHTWIYKKRCTCTTTYAEYYSFYCIIRRNSAGFLLSFFFYFCFQNITAVAGCQYSEYMKLTYFLWHSQLASVSDARKRFIAFLFKRWQKYLIVLQSMNAHMCIYVCIFIRMYEF